MIGGHRDSVLDVIRQALEDEENAFKADYVESMLAEDAVLMVPSFPVQEGKAACASRKYFWLYSRYSDGAWKLARFIVSLDEQDDEQECQDGHPGAAG